MIQTDPATLASGILPQTYGRERVDHIRQPIVEPLWLGRRVIVAATADRVDLYEDGASVDGHELVRVRLSQMLAHTAEGVILDGYLTKSSMADDEPAPVEEDLIPTRGEVVAKSFVGIRRDRSAEKIKRLDAAEAARVFGPTDVVNLVATDLLWVDGEWLLDVPLLERKRVLEAVIPGDDLVRAGPYVQPPFGTWIGSWRAQGFSALTFKEVNSRYQPGAVSKEWAITDMPRR